MTARPAARQSSRSAADCSRDVVQAMTHWTPGATDHLIVFARVPVLGQVKTRLAAGLGQQQALMAYREMLQGAVRALGEVAGVTRWLCLTGTDSDGECAALAHRHDCGLMRQIDGHLGARMAHALRHCLEHGARRAILIGCDSPPIDAAVLSTALHALIEHDSVWGPTEDGGYALVGVKRLCESVFEAIDWGGAQVMTQTRERLRNAGLSALELPVLWDVDEPPDWQRWQAWLADQPRLP